METSPFLDAIPAEGELRTARVCVVEVLDERFGAVPAETKEAVMRETDLPLLTASLRWAIKVKSPHEIRVFLQRRGK